MLIPSIDLMGGKIVQLVQGEKKALESSDYDHWIGRFSSFPLVQLIDLDAAMNHGNNRELAGMICDRLPCQVGGGIRSVNQAQEWLAVGARRVIFGSVLLNEGRVNTAFAQQVSHQLGSDRLTFAIDSRGGKVAVKGWKEQTSIDPMEMIGQLESCCSAFLYTHIDSEGTLAGFPLAIAHQLRTQTSKRLIVAGGIRSLSEVEALAAIDVDAVVGMAIYMGKIG